MHDSVTPDGQSGNSGFDYIRKSIRADFESGKITEARMLTLLSAGDFAERHGVFFTYEDDLCPSFDLWGFGRVRMAFFHGSPFQMWMWIFDAAEVTGLSHDELFPLALDALKEGHPDVDSVDVWWEDGLDPVRIPVVNHKWVLRVLATISPWQQTFLDNISEYMTYAMGPAESGGKLRSWGKSLELARAQASRGISGALDRIADGAQ